ncbi:MAG: hypothetical protein ACLQK4_10285 [Acidimicrobiales bacterium]
METGLSYSPDAPPRRPHDISTHVGSDGTWVALAAWSPPAQTCVGILQITAPQSPAALGISGADGGYYFIVRGSTQVACDAATISSVTSWSQSGFPAY